MTQPQLILTLGPSGLQAELPSANGSRRVVPLSGSSDRILDSLHRLLLAQQQGEIKIGQVGAPTSQQLHHTIKHRSPADGCPFCNLGLQHSNRQCNNSSSPRRSKLRHSPVRHIIDIPLSELGL